MVKFGILDEQRIQRWMWNIIQMPKHMLWVNAGQSQNTMKNMQKLWLGIYWNVAKMTKDIFIGKKFFVVHGYPCRGD